MKRRQQLGALVAVLGVALAGAVLVPAVAHAATPGGSSNAAPPITGNPYPGDPAKEAAIVATEDQRVYNLRAITAAARWQGIATLTPYEVNLGSVPTLVLVGRKNPYTLSDIQTLIPSTFVRQPDATYLLTENIVVEDGGVLDLSNPDGVTIHLSSSSKGFVSIVGLGGSIRIAGSAAAPVRIGSWDPTLGTVDTNTADGRSYLRLIGGTANFTYVNFDHLGFWSGGTGGLALTGTSIKASTLAKVAAPKTVAPPVTTKVHGVTIKPVGPTGTITDVASAIAGATGGYSYVTASLSHVGIEANAFGLFVNGSKGVRISNTSVRDSLISGIVFHRFVTNSTITSTVTENNAVDGFAMTRASTGILINGLTANGNGRDGIVLNGGPLANGPNAAGTPVGSYGNNSLARSTSANNARYGISVLGGNGVKVDHNLIRNNIMGIVVSKAAVSVIITGNTVDRSIKHAIAVLGGSSKTTIRENSLSGADIGIYLRDSSATIERNHLANVSNHGITLIGVATGSSVVNNTVGGTGPNAVDTARATGTTVHDNNILQWTNTKPLTVILAEIFQPLTVLWMILGLVVLISVLSGIGRKRSGFRHPYANQVPLSSLTRGVVRPEELGLARSHIARAMPTLRAAAVLRARPTLSVSKRRRGLLAKAADR